MVPAMMPSPRDDLLAFAWEHHRAGRLAEAEGLYRRILVECPGHPEALHGLGILAGQAGGAAGLSASVLTLAKGVVLTMFLRKFQVAGFVLLAMAVASMVLPRPGAPIRVSERACSTKLGSR